MITLTVNTAQSVRKIDTIARSLDDLKPAFTAWNKWKRAKVQKSFDSGGPGWPATKKQAAIGADSKKAEKVAEQSRQLADEMLRKKLQRQLRRAKKRNERGRGTAESVERRYLVLKEFERIAAGGSDSFSITGDKRLDKSIRGLRERQHRAQEKASTQTLGRIASSIKSKITRYDVTVYSEIPWAGAHNEGATVGKGSKLPKRTFLDLDDEDLEMLAKFIEAQVNVNGE